MSSDLQAMIASLSAQLGDEPHPVTIAELDGLTALLPLVTDTLATTFGPWFPIPEETWPGLGWMMRKAARDTYAVRVGGGCSQLIGALGQVVLGTVSPEMAMAFADLLARMRGYRLVNE